MYYQMRLFYIIPHKRTRRKWTIWHIQLSVLYQLPYLPLSDMGANPPKKTKLHPRGMKFGLS